MKKYIPILAAFAALSAQAAIIQLTPFAGTIVQTKYTEFINNSNAQHFEELDDFFVLAALTLEESSGQINTQSQLPADSSEYNAMVVRYEKNGPAKDLIGAFALNGVTSITDAILDGTVPTGFDHHQIFLYLVKGPGGVDPFITPPPVPDGGTTAGLLGLGALALALGRKIR